MRRSRSSTPAQATHVRGARAAAWPGRMARSPAMTERLMLLDSASLYFRAFFGVPDPRSAPSEPPTNAVRGFLDMIATLVEPHRPTHLVACWDNDWRPAFRVEAIPTYKTHRVDRRGSDGRSEEVPDDAHARRCRSSSTRSRRSGSPGSASTATRPTTSSARSTHRARGRACRSTSSPATATCSSWSTTPAQVRVLYTARGGVRDPDLVDQAFLRDEVRRRHRRRLRRHGRRCAATPATGCPGSPGSARRPPPR